MSSFTGFFHFFLCVPPIGRYVLFELLNGQLSNVDKPSHYLSVGGCFVEGDWLRNAFRWKETIGQWEERPGHFGDVWNYWTDDGLGHFEFLQVIFYVAQLCCKCI